MDTLPPHAQNNNLIPATGGIYKITCTANGKIYVGSTVNLSKRKKDHFSYLRRNKHRNAYMQQSWNKYGEESFIFEVLELVLIPECLIFQEQYWFDKLKPFGRKGFNIAAEAGHRVRLGRKHTPEARAKMGLPHIGNKYSLGIKRSPETIQRLRDSHIGKPSTFKGQHHTPEAIEKLRQARSKQISPMTGRKHTPETIEKIRQANTGREVPPEQIEKARQANTGKKRTPEQIERFSEAQQKMRAETPSNSSTGFRGIIVWEEKRPQRRPRLMYKFTCQCKACRISKTFPYGEEGLEAAKAFAEAHYAAMERKE